MSREAESDPLGCCRTDVSVITANPKTAGVARWNFLALWGHLMHKGDDVAHRFVTDVRHMTWQLDVVMLFLQSHILLRTWNHVLTLIEGCRAPAQYLDTDHSLIRQIL